MNRQLTKRKKKLKRIEARRRVIFWSEQEIRKKQLNAQSKIGAISISQPSDTPSKPSRYSDIASQLLSETTVPSLQKIIKDLKIQRQEQDITIKVLSNHLQQLLNNSKPKKSHKRTKTDG